MAKLKGATREPALGVRTVGCVKLRPTRCPPTACPRSSVVTRANVDNGLDEALYWAVGSHAFGVE